jgi:hypothetical protein
MELRGIQPLKQLFWSELSYQRINEPLSRRGWTESANKALADDPVLFAGGGENDDFHVIYARLASDRLSLASERPVVSRLLNEHPYTLFVFSNDAQDHWHFLNVKYDETTHSRRLFRRITVGPYERLRTATDRISLLALDDISPEFSGLSPLTIQQRHDEAFDVEAVTKRFFDDFCNIFTKVAKDLRERNTWMDGEAVERETQTLLNRLLNGLRALKNFCLSTLQRALTRMNTRYSLTASHPKKPALCSNSSTISARVIPPLVRGHFKLGCCTRS